MVMMEQQSEHGRLRAADRLCAILRGVDVPLSDLASRADQSGFLDACATHGVTSLVYHRLRRQINWEAWPTPFSSLLTQQARLQTVVSMLREQELLCVLHSLDACGVHPLLMKGVPLGYTHYLSPDMRPCCDTDLLVQRRDMERIDRVLRRLGYARCNLVSGELIMSQCAYVKASPHGIEHIYDIHWKVSNRHVFAERLSFDTLVQDAIPVPGLGANARTLAPGHALLLACLHRIAHHHDSDRLIWLYDIHLLLNRMTHDEQVAFVQLAIDKELRAVCWNGLTRANCHFATRLPQLLWEALSPKRAAAVREATAPFLTSRPRGFQPLYSDFCALRGWQRKLLLLKEHLFPPAAYMFSRYTTRYRLLLPILYLRRILRGLPGLWHQVE